MTIDKIKAERITSATRQFGRMMCNYQSAFARAAPLNYLRFARNPKLRVAYYVISNAKKTKLWI